VNSGTTAPAAPAARPPWLTFAFGLGLITTVGLAIRLVYVLAARQGVCGGGILVPGCPGDAWVYHHSADLLARGKGFISPVDYALSHGRLHLRSADHPPLLIVVLAAASFVGLGSWTAHLLVVVAIGTTSIVVAGLMGREVFGPRVALVGAALVAVNPNVWINDGNVLSESAAILGTLLIAWAAYRLWARPSWGRAALLGAAIGAAMLVRPESGMLLVVVALPIVALRRDTAWRDRLVRLVAVGVAAFVVCLPWVGYNLARFNHPVTLSTGFGITLANTNCDLTYYGDRTGYWSPECIPAFQRTRGQDQSDDELFLRRTGLDYITSHKGRFPVVVAARLGRMFNLYAVRQQVELDFWEGRPTWASWIALGFFYPTMALAALGAVATRRRRIPLSPLLGPVVVVVANAVLTFGHARYRAPAEGVLCVLAAVGVDAMVRRSRGATGWRSRARGPRRTSRAPLPPAGEGASTGTGPRPASTP